MSQAECNSWVEIERIIREFVDGEVRSLLVGWSNYAGVTPGNMRVTAWSAYKRSSLENVDTCEGILAASRVKLAQLVRERADDIRRYVALNACSSDVFNCRRLEEQVILSLPPIFHTIEGEIVHEAACENAMQFLFGVCENFAVHEKFAT